MINLKSLFVFVLLVGLLGICYAKVDINRVYGLMNEDDLKAVIKQCEKDLIDTPSDSYALKTLGIAYHNLGALKRKDAPANAVKYLERARLISPNDYTILAYLGSATTMGARDSWNFFTKLSEVNKGVNLIDNAIASDPTNIIIRVVRAKNCLELPSFLNRKPLAKQDLLYAEELLKKNSSGLDINTKADVFRQLGNIFKSENNPEQANYYFKKESDCLLFPRQK